MEYCSTAFEDKLSHVKLEAAKDEDESTEGESIVDSDEIENDFERGQQGYNSTQNAGVTGPTENVEWGQFDDPGRAIEVENLHHNAPSVHETRDGEDFVQAGSLAVAVVEAAPARKRRKYSPADRNGRFSSL